MKTKILLAFLVLFIGASSTFSQEKSIKDMSNELVVVWSSDDPYIAERVALMYTHAAKTNKWFKKVTLIIWGPSAKLITENIKLQEKIAKMRKDGVIVEACIACGDAYGVSDKLKKLGYDTKPMGAPLSNYLKGNAKVLTF